MATQIIQCPADLLQELRAGFGLRRISPEGLPITLVPMTIEGDCRSLMVGVNHVWLTWDRWPSHDDGEVFVLVLTSDPNPHDQFTPRPLASISVPFSSATRDDAAALMRPARDVLQERPLGKAVNNVKNNAPELLV